jgi:hypothetical protein
METRIAPGSTSGAASSNGLPAIEGDRTDEHPEGDLDLVDDFFRAFARSPKFNTPKISIG